MKKKVLAFLLASTMVIEPFSVASAADFSDGIEQENVQFGDDAENVPEVENDVESADQFSTDAAGEGEEPTETHVQIGDKVWVDFDNVNGIIYWMERLFRIKTNEIHLLEKILRK